jgi:hypothetical protein
LTDDKGFETVQHVVHLQHADNVVVCACAPLAWISNDITAQACALKLRLWEMIPPGIDTVALIDVDAVILDDVPSEIIDIAHSTGRLVAARELFTSHEEMLRQDISVLPSTVQPHSHTTGKILCINTGLVGMTRKHHAFMSEVLRCWEAHVLSTGQQPRLLDQGLLNRCLDTGSFLCTWSDVELLATAYNALDQYEMSVDLDRGGVFMGSERVRMLHFSGGNVCDKIARRTRALPLRMDLSVSTAQCRT